MHRLDVSRAARHVVAHAHTEFSLSKAGTPADSPLLPTRQRFKQPFREENPLGQAEAKTDLLRAMADACATVALRARLTTPQGAAAP